MMKNNVVMNKSILVLDKPDSCVDCGFCEVNSNNRYENYKCILLKDKEIPADTAENEVFDKCPLRPVPDKKNLTGDVSNVDTMCAELVRVGFNACVTEILSGTYSTPDKPSTPTIKLPCNFGDTVWLINSACEDCTKEYHGCQRTCGEPKYVLERSKVTHFVVKENEIIIHTNRSYGTLGEDAFLNEVEANEVLERLNK